LLPQLASTIKLKKAKKIVKKLSKNCQKVFKKVVKKLSKNCQKVVKKLLKSSQKVVKKLSKNSKSCQSCQKIVKLLSKSFQKVVKKMSKVIKNLSEKILVKNLSKMFVKNLSIICSFDQIVRRRRRLVAPRPGGDFVVPGKNRKILQYYCCLVGGMTDISFRAMLNNHNYKAQ
jgi:uncharacterized membrane protein YheB (UPF0754 family)